MSEKTSIEIKMFWYTNILVIPKFVTLITTVDKDGIVNAAPYSLGTSYNVGKKTPQIIIGMRRSSHSCQNAIKTGEFVVNFPSSKHLRDVMETAQFVPKEKNELDYTQFTVIPSRKVKPPSIKECYQHLECKLHDVVELDNTQTQVIGDIVEIVVDKKMIDMRRLERIKAVDPPIYLGDERRRLFYFGKIGEVEEIEFKLPETGDRRKKIRTNMPWEETAVEKLTQIPVALREMVIDMVEDMASKSGCDKITYEFYKKLEDDYAPKDYDNQHY